MGEFIVRFFNGSDTTEKKSAMNGTMLAPCWHYVGTMLELSDEELKKILISCKKAININELMNIFSWRDRTKFRNKYIKPLMKEGLIKMTIPDKPKSIKQKYIVTDKGKDLLKSEMAGKEV